MVFIGTKSEIYAAVIARHIRNRFIQRIMRRLLPADEKISKDAKEVLQESLSEFVCFVTEEAAGRCAEEKRKTINGDDLIFALQNLGFEEYVPPLQSYLAQYRRVSKQKEKE